MIGLNQVANLLGISAGGGDAPAIGDGNYGKWPMSKFSFRVNIGGMSGVISFETMDGLGATVAKMEYRDGNSKLFYKQHRPTLTSYDPVTLKKGLFEGDSGLYEWFTNVSTGSFFGDTREVTIELTEVGGAMGDHLSVLFTWTLHKAYVTKFTPPSLDGGDDSSPAVEELEIAYQSFSSSARPNMGHTNSFVLPPRVDLTKTIAPKEVVDYEKVDLTKELEEKEVVDYEKVDLTKELEEKEVLDYEKVDLTNELEEKEVIDYEKVDLTREAEMEDNSDDEKVDLSKTATDIPFRENAEVELKDGLKADLTQSDAHKDEDNSTDKIDLTREAEMEDNSDDEKVDLTREAEMADNSDDEKVDLTKELEDRSEEEAAINAAREEAREARREQQLEEQAARDAAREEKEAENEKKQEEQRKALDDAIETHDDGDDE